METLTKLKTLISEKHTPFRSTKKWLAMRRSNGIIVLVRKYRRKCHAHAFSANEDTTQSFSQKPCAYMCRADRNYDEKTHDRRFVKIRLKMLLAFAKFDCANQRYRYIKCFAWLCLIATSCSQGEKIGGR